jgi:hypothetical protein
MARRGKDLRRVSSCAARRRVCAPHVRISGGVRSRTVALLPDEGLADEGCAWWAATGIHLKQIGQ